MRPIYGSPRWRFGSVIPLTPFLNALENKRSRFSRFENPGECDGRDRIPNIAVEKGIPSSCKCSSHLCATYLYLFKVFFKFLHHVL